MHISMMISATLALVILVAIVLIIWAGKQNPATVDVSPVQEEPSEEQTVAPPEKYQDNLDEAFVELEAIDL